MLLQEPVKDPPTVMHACPAFALLLTSEVSKIIAESVNDFMFKVRS
jgi:hypothetical protein